MLVARQKRDEYSDEAHAAFLQLDSRVNAIFSQVQSWRGWQTLNDPDTPDQSIVAIIREVFRSVCWYQSHTTEAGFHMFGRLPKHEVKLIQALCSHKAEEAEHGVWAREDFLKLGGTSQGLSEPPSPATFAMAAVWWRMASVEEPLGYIGAEYLFEQLTALVTQQVVPIIHRRNLPRAGLRFVIEHATEDAKHATLFKHLILDVSTRYPESIKAMQRCFDYFNAIYPLPVWDEAYCRATKQTPFAEPERGPVVQASGTLVC